jgi:hypothetical protein
MGFIRLVSKTLGKRNLTKSSVYLFFIFIFLGLFGVTALNAFEVTFVGNTVDIPRGTQQTAYLTLLGDQEKSEEIELFIEEMFPSSSFDLRRWVYLEKNNLRLDSGYQHRLLVFIKPGAALTPGLYQAWIKVKAAQSTTTRVIRIPLSVQLQ